MKVSAQLHTQFKEIQTICICNQSQNTTQHIKGANKHVQILSLYTLQIYFSFQLYSVEVFE